MQPMEAILADLELEFWEVLRLGTLGRALTPGDFDRLLATSKIAGHDMVCVRFVAFGKGAAAFLNVVVDGKGKTLAESIEAARLIAVGKRVVID